MSTLANSIILPYNKSKLICQQTLTTASTHSIYIAVEQSAAAFTWLLTSIDVDTFVDLKIYSVGDNERDEQLLYESPLLRNINQTPLSFEIECPGPLRMDVSTTGAVSYTVRGKAIDAALITDQVVSLSNETTELRQWRAQVIQALDYNNELLEKVVNHLRVVTNINKDDGESF